MAGNLVYTCSQNDIILYVNGFNTPFADAENILLMWVVAFVKSPKNPLLQGKFVASILRVTTVSSNWCRYRRKVDTSTGEAQDIDTGNLALLDFDKTFQPLQPGVGLLALDVENDWRYWLNSYDHRLNQLYRGVLCTRRPLETDILMNLDGSNKQPVFTVDPVHKIFSPTYPLLKAVNIIATYQHKYTKQRFQRQPRKRRLSEESVNSNRSA
jgi:hypothetical protein